MQESDFIRYLVYSCKRKRNASIREEGQEYRGRSLDYTLYQAISNALWRSGFVHDDISSDVILF
jgi:hypothetical protein